MSNFSKSRYSEAQEYLPKFYQAIKERFSSLLKVVSEEAIIDEAYDNFPVHYLTPNDYFYQVDILIVTTNKDIYKAQCKVRYKDDIYIPLKATNYDDQRIIYGQYKPEGSDKCYLVNFEDADIIICYYKKSDSVKIYKTDILRMLSCDKDLWVFGEIKKTDNNKEYLVLEADLLNTLYHDKMMSFTFGIDTKEANQVLNEQQDLFAS